MADRASPARHRYLSWVEDQIEEYKAAVPREELLELADEAVRDLYEAPDGQYTLTELVLRETVDALIFRRLKLPSFQVWRRTHPSDEVTADASTDPAA